MLERSLIPSGGGAAANVVEKPVLRAEPSAEVVRERADDDKACYDLTLSLIEKAALYIEKHDKGEQTFGGQKYTTLDESARNALLVQLLPKLRGLVSQSNRFIGTLHVTKAGCNSPKLFTPLKCILMT